MTPTDPKCSPVLPNLINTFFLELEDKFNRKIQTEFSPDDILVLHAIFGDILSPALELIDKNRIKLYLPPNKRRGIVEIQASHSSGYTCKFFPNINYCSCGTFQNDVLRIGKTYTCKHVLAAKLAIIRSKPQEEVVAADLFNFFIQTIGED